MAKILVVEDDAILARSIVRALGFAGHSATLAPSVTAAVASVGPFDCGVFDILLPDGNGVDLAERLLGQGSVALAVFFSSTTDERICLRATEDGVFIPKAEGVTRLVEVVSEHLTTQGSPG